MARFFVPFACLLLGSSFATLSAQVTRCSADAHLEAQIASDTVFARSFLALETALENMASTGFRSTEVHTLPVVVHIMHAGDAVGSGANISDAQVASAIEALNADFAGEFGGADVDVEFALAVRDPLGNPTTGIKRVNAAAIIPEFASDGMVTNNNMAASSEVNVKTLSHWPGEDYVNIWVVSKLNGGTSPIGFAYLPPTTGVVDGIVVHHKVFGVGEEYDLMNNYDLNRTLTHEVGHYLSLYHTFHQTNGCSGESNCSAQGDRVCDTPPTSGSVNCSALECEGTMVENFMDYSNDPCMSSFTEGQRTRMRNALVQNRFSLVESLALVPVVDMDAGVSSVQGISPGGCAATHSPQAVLQNFGTTPISNATIYFQLDGGEEHQVAWEGELEPNQTALVTLPTLAATVGEHSLTVRTETPNDEYAANDILVLDFEVVPGNMVSMEIQFDFLPYGITWAIESPAFDAPILSGGDYINGEFASELIEIEGCATPGCYTLTVEDLFGNGMHYSPPGWYELTDSNGNVLGAGSGDFGSEQSHEFCIEAVDVTPCPDVNANGVCDADEDLLVTDVLGCTDPESCTFDDEATLDNGSCDYLDALNECGGDCPTDIDGDGVCDNAEVIGCTDDTACNYDSDATDESGLCTYPETNYDCDGNVVNVIEGCTDTESCTYTEEANTDDGSCAYLDALNDCGGDCPEDLDQDGVCDNAEIEGCTEALACNYNADATEEDDSCEFALEGFDCEGNPITSGIAQTPVEETTLVAYPNPVTAGEIHLSGLPGAGHYTLCILDMGGRCVFQERAVAIQTLNSWGLRSTLDLQPGMYMLHISGQSASYKPSGIRVLLH